MKRISARDAPARLRARRWDAIVVGGALPGLFAATQLALGGKRVLLVEEETAARIPPSQRDPFIIPHRVDSPIDRCLRTLGLPLIDRRRMNAEPVGLQVLLPGVRADIGDQALSTDELVAWGIEKPEAAANWVDSLVAAAEADRIAMEQSALVRAGRGRGAGRALGLTRRSVSEALPSTPNPGLEAWVAAFGHGVGEHPSSARALGAAFEGVGCFATAAESLTGLLRQRFQALHGEIRLVSSRFSLVTVDGAAAIRPGHGAELWVSRAMILNAPVSSLRHFIREAGGDPDFLPERRVRARRVGVHFDTEREQIPEGMARRVVDATEGPETPVRIAWNPSRSGARVELSASACTPHDDAAQIEALKESIVRRVVALMPFAGERLERRDALGAPAWDDASVLEEIAPDECWPQDIGIRLVSRPPVYLLPREAVATLGAEGECFLGWRAGELILSELG